MVGALRYLTMTRPDFTYIVCLVSQFMHAPRMAHMFASKHFYMYLIGTGEFGIWHRLSEDLSLILAYFDAD
ncbi:Retrovirus-related Pol polyprotein from transposon RE1 [Bienertia sinuspersici]